MELVVTLITNPEQANLTQQHVDCIQAALNDAGSMPASPSWLAESIACDITFEGDDIPSFRKLMQGEVWDLGIDSVVQPITNRRKRLLLADMDSTIVTGETLDELAGIAGLKDRVAAITERAMRGEIDFKAALRERVAILKGLPATALDKTLEITELTSGARQLVQTMRTNDAHTVLVSGGFKFFTSAIGKKVGFHEDRSNEMIIKNGILTGTVGDPILDRDAKLDALNSISSAKEIPIEETMATGDGANDLPMILAAGLGIAFHAKPVVEEKAPAAIRHGDLTALLYIQGYRREEFKE
ncbi:MAG: phosphoserine phosphatase SerB [Alphaproteobacteria bacterium]|nr:phosphoserine phosphatase SerB [Alphaproteobacteria bacterium]